LIDGIIVSSFEFFRPDTKSLDSGHDTYQVLKGHSRKNPAIQNQGRIDPLNAPNGVLTNPMVLFKFKKIKLKWMKVFWVRTFKPGIWKLRKESGYF
jgi:hypothetical protein